MHLNSNICECMRMWSNPANAPDFDYLGPEGEEIIVNQSLKDLGVHLNSDLTIKLQVEKIVSEASKMSGWELRTFIR